MQTCTNVGQNWKDVEQIDIFGDGGGDGALEAESAPADGNQTQQ